MEDKHGLVGEVRVTNLATSCRDIKLIISWESAQDIVLIILNFYRVICITCAGIMQERKYRT